MHLRLLPDNTNIDFVKYRWIAFGLTLMMAVITVVVLLTHGLNLGTDFRGGILIEARSPAAIELQPLREKLDSLQLGQIELQEFGGPNDVLIRLKRQEGGETEQNAAVAKVREAMGTGYEYRRVEMVGPRAGEDLRNAALFAIAAAMIGIGIYIALRFEWQFGVVALIATFHDVLITVGLYAILRMEFDLTAVAALLTLAGYAVNDAVVVFDRIRENLRRAKGSTLKDVINTASNQVLSRSIMTSLTTLLAIIPLVLFGGNALFNFALATTVGIAVATFSSLFVAAPILLYMKPVRGIPSGIGKTTEAEAAN
jgi:preprotein translocase subunit SecF